MTRRHAIATPLVFCALLPAGLSAQHNYNDFSMEPYSGVYFDAEVEGPREMGPILGVRIGYEPLDRVRLIADFAYSEVNGAGTFASGGSTFVYGNDWIFTMAGVEFDVVPGPTAGLFSLVGGVAWRQTEIERRVSGAAPDPDQGGFASSGMIAPGIALRHALGSRAAVRLAVQDFILDFENPEHSPAITLGVSFR